MTEWKLIGRPAERRAAAAVLDRIVQEAARRLADRTGGGTPTREDLDDAVDQVGTATRRADVYSMMSSACAHDPAARRQIRDALRCHAVAQPANA